MDDVKFEFYRGDTFSKSIEISGLTQNIEKMYFTVKESEYASDYIFQKRIDDGISLVDDLEDKKTYSILIESSDTDNMKSNHDYPFDIEIIAGKDNPIKRTIVKGVVRLKNDITRPKDEV